MTLLRLGELQDLASDALDSNIPLSFSQNLPSFLAVHS